MKDDDVKMVLEEVGGLSQKQYDESIKNSIELNREEHKTKIRDYAIMSIFCLLVYIGLSLFAEKDSNKAFANLALFWFGIFFNYFTMTYKSIREYKKETWEKKAEEDIYNMIGRNVQIKINELEQVENSD